MLITQEILVFVALKILLCKENDPRADNQLWTAAVGEKGLDSTTAMEVSDSRVVVKASQTKNRKKKAVAVDLMEDVRPLKRLNVGELADL